MALEAKRAAHIHLPEESLEDYAFGRLPSAEWAVVEEHILVCEDCQERLEAEDNFAEAMFLLTRMERNSSLPAFSSSSAPAPSALDGRTLRVWLGRRPISGALLSQIREFVNWNRDVAESWHAGAWGAGGAGIPAVGFGILAVGFGILSWALPPSPSSVRPVMPRLTQMADSVTLQSLRGGSGDGIAEARPNRPLNLSIESGEMASSAVALGHYRLEVVDAAGNQAWAGPVISSVSGKFAARVEKGLAAGVYWVRLYAPSGKLLREYGLRLG